MKNKTFAFARSNRIGNAQEHRSTRAQTLSGQRANQYYNAKCKCIQLWYKYIYRQIDMYIIYRVYCTCLAVKHRWLLLLLLLQIATRNRATGGSRTRNVARCRCRCRCRAQKLQPTGPSRSSETCPLCGRKENHFTQTITAACGLCKQTDVETT